MPEAITLAGQIILMAMGLVFVAILLARGLTSARGRLTRPQPPGEERSAPPAEEQQEQDDREIKEQAAALAVSIALAQRRKQQTWAEGQATPRVPAPPPTATVSPWQAVTRANQLNQKRPRR